MRYYKFSAAERKLVMAEAELPEPGPGQVRVRVAAASLNYRDVFMISRFGDVGIDNRIPLSDASGAVDAVGDGATRFRLGDRVATIFFPDWISGRFRSSYAPSAFGGERADGVLSVANGQIYAFANQVDMPLRHRQIDRHLWISLKELRE
jgi:NADPH:quinone reductase-like Zn-dependent oxidoreductase